MFLRINTVWQRIISRYSSVLIFSCTPNIHNILEKHIVSYFIISVLHHCVPSPVDIYYADYKLRVFVILHLSLCKLYSNIPLRKRFQGKNSPRIIFAKKMHVLSHPSPFMLHQLSFFSVYLWVSALVDTFQDLQSVVWQRWAVCTMGWYTIIFLHLHAGWIKQGSGLLFWNLHMILMNLLILCGDHFYWQFLM